MKYLKTLIIIIGYYLTEVLQLFWTFFVYKMRRNARQVVYDRHYITGQYLYGFKRDKYITANNPGYLKYLLYYWFVWIWINDRLSDDMLSTNLMKKLYMSKNTNKLTKRLIERSGCLTRIDSKSYIENYNVGFTNKDYDDRLILLQLLYSKESNYTYKYFYTTNGKIVFNFKLFGKELGWLEDHVDSDSKIVYKLNLT